MRSPGYLYIAKQNTCIVRIRRSLINDTIPVFKPAEMQEGSWKHTPMVDQFKHCIEPPDKIRKN